MPYARLKYVGMASHIEQDTCICERLTYLVGALLANGLFLAEGYPTERQNPFQLLY